MFADRLEAESVRKRTAAGRGAGLALVSLVMSGALLAGCTVVEGNTAKLDDMKKTAATQPAPQPATSAPAASDALTTGSLGDQSIASAGIPIPLISPRHLEGVRVASVDPRAGLSALGVGGLPVRQLAGVYLKYDGALAVAEKSKLGTPKEVRRVLKDLRYSEPDSMAEGWYAVQAMTAAQTTAFAQGVRDEVRRIGQDKMLASLDDPNYVLRLPGADAASTAVLASVAAENDRMLSLRKRFLDTAQKFMREKWGMIEPLSPAKFAEAESAGKTSLASLLHEFSPIGEAQAYSPTVMTKILALGARQVVSAPVLPVAQRDETSTCLNWARLNLNQCIAAAHFPSEEAWCTGTHAIEEVRSCWASVLPASATMTPAAH